MMAEPRRVRRLRLGWMTVAFAALLIACFAVAGVIVTAETLRISELAEESRDRIVPMILERQRALINLARLRQYGATVLATDEPRVREETLLLSTFLVNHPSFQFDPQVLDAVRHANSVIHMLAEARERKQLSLKSGQAEDDTESRRIEAEWRKTEIALETLSDSLVVSATNLISDRTQSMGTVAERVKEIVLSGLTLLAMALAGVAYFINRMLLRPILLATAALDIDRPKGLIELPRSGIVEIELLYRTTERMASAMAQVEAANRQARAAQAELRRLASTDELTGLANRRWFQDMARRELERCRRFGHPLSVLMIDIDHFKRINDTHGHAVGDDVLKAVARVLENSLRAVDLLGRMGGEEFAAALPETARNEAIATAERLRSGIEALEVPLESGAILRLTTSVGVAFARDADVTLDSLLARADDALYAAKREGRNLVRAG